MPSGPARTPRPSRAVAVPLLAAIAAAALPATAGAVGLSPVFPRTITRTLTAQDVRVARFEVTTRAAGVRSMRVTVRVGVVSLRGRRPLVIAVAPCTGGTSTSPLCRPAATARIQVGSARVGVTRSFLVRRPARTRDAVRVTLTAGDAPIPFRPENVGGGGGTAEILLNGGTWRFRQGTPWGLTSASPGGVVLERVDFNSRRYEWRGTTPAATTATTSIGYADETPRWVFRNVMSPARPFAFYRTPSQPVQAVRTAPREFVYRADVGAGRLFTVRLPLPAWAGSS